MKNKYFPVQQDPACLLKWTWSTIFFQSGTSASCHRTQKYAIDPDNFDNFHNLDDKIIAREKMLDGKWPYAGCQYCKKVEDAGGISDRQMHIDSLVSDSLVPPELKDNPTETHVTPAIIEVYFANTCNMKCVYCGPHFSSLWESENRKHGQPMSKHEGEFAVTAPQHNPNYDKMVADFWNYLSTNDRYKILQRYHILGGEPFIIPELQQSIDFWKDHPNMDLTFSVISNLNVPHDIFKKYIDQFEELAMNNCIWRLQLTASLDCWSKNQEYTRYGLNLDQWEKNFQYCINKPWIQLSVNSALSALSLNHFGDLVEKINYWNTLQTNSFDRWDIQPILHSFNTTGNFDDPYFFGEHFVPVYEKILELMPEKQDFQKHQKQSMQGILTRQKQSKVDFLAINNLKMYLDQLDSRRNTNWRAVFPWLDQDFNV